MSVLMVNMKMTAIVSVRKNNNTKIHASVKKRELPYMKQVSSEYQIVSALERPVWSSSSPVYSKEQKQTEDDCYPAFFSLFFLSKKHKRGRGRNETHK